MKPCGAPGRKRQGWIAEDQMKNENTGNGVAGMVMPFFVYEQSWVGRGMNAAVFFDPFGRVKKYPIAVEVFQGVMI